jgi:hypothetical protein
MSWLAAQILQNAATAPGNGASAIAGVNHSFEVTVTGTGAVSVTIEPRTAADKAPGAGNLISTAQTVSGTGAASQTFTASGLPAVSASCPITAISGTGATCTITYTGA